MYTKFIDKIPNIVRKLLMVIIDVVIIICAYMLTNVFKEIIVEISTQPFITSCTTAVLVYIIIFYLSKVYRSLIQYSSAREYCVIAIASIISASLVSTIGGIIEVTMVGPKTHMLAGVLVAIGCIAARVIFRMLINAISNHNKYGKKRVLIIGAGEAASQVINNIKLHMHGEYRIVGMIDDSSNKQKSRIYGVEVLGNRNDITKIVENKKVDLILFTIQNIRARDKNEILDICNKTDVCVKIIMPMEKLILGKQISENFRDIQVEDLLGRDPVQLDNSEISNYISNKVVLVTGAGGSIGSELCRQIITFNPKLLVMLDIYENTLYETELELRRKDKNINIETVVASVRDAKRLDEIFEEYKPELVFHAAAHKHVPLMENSPLEAIKNNVFGTYNVSNSADKHGVEKFILISTDKAVNPTNIMGASKRLCEMIIQTKSQNSDTKFAAVRFGNVLGSHGSVIPIFKQQIAEGGPITITHKDITRYFMLIPEAVQLILQAMLYANDGEIFVLDMGKPVKIYDLAKTMIKLSGKKVDITITGLRPGEKLYEELLIAEEGLQRTLHEKIMVSKIKPISEEDLENNMEKLRTLLNDENVSKQLVKDTIKEVVPTYIDVDKEGQPEKQKIVSDGKNKKAKSMSSK